ncbi:MAG: hypothetical protein JST54_29255 [Deltaproteobacteria bacterium]|nr:hypothetical protein [Deltaproteobacteria bacterium]
MAHRALARLVAEVFARSGGIRLVALLSILSSAKWLTRLSLRYEFHPNQRIKGQADWET